MALAAVRTRPYGGHRGGDVTDTDRATGADHDAAAGMEPAAEIKFGVLHLSPRQLRTLRVVPRWIIGFLIVFAVAWVLVLADRSFTTETSAGSAIAEPAVSCSVRKPRATISVYSSR